MQGWYISERPYVCGDSSDSIERMAESRLRDNLCSRFAGSPNHICLWAFLQRSTLINAR